MWHNFLVEKLTQVSRKVLLRTDLSQSRHNSQIGTIVTVKQPKGVIHRKIVAH